VTHQENYTFSKTFIDELIEAGFDGIPEMFRVIMNNAMKTERDQFLQANKYERTEDRLGYANGYAKHAFGETKDNQITSWRSLPGHSTSAGRWFLSLFP